MVLLMVKKLLFQSTLPARGATPGGSSWSCWPSYFNPRSPRGERQISLARVRTAPTFQSTLPARGATGVVILVQVDVGISIHAPREGSDRAHHRLRRAESNFNPRSPRGERPRSRMMGYPWTLFQSTLPARGATRGATGRPPIGEFQSTLPARGATSPLPRRFPAREFQSTLPARGATSQVCGHPQELRGFQSTLPARGATGRRSAQGRHSADFNPRSPRGERRADTIAALQKMWISIHAPREGSDRRQPGHHRQADYFNPRSPRGERPGRAATSSPTPGDFNPRSPRGERR